MYLGAILAYFLHTGGVVMDWIVIFGVGGLSPLLFFFKGD